MKLKRLRIVNCSRIADIDVEVRDNMVLIGPNGSGKTTVLLCLDMLLGMDDQRLREAFPEGFVRDESRPLSIEALLEKRDSEGSAMHSGENGDTSAGKFSLRLDIRANGGAIDVSRSFSQVGAGAMQKDSSQERQGVFGWKLVKPPASLRNTRQDWAPADDGVDILAIDEPEAHLHPSSQRSLAKKLKASGSQKVLVTHSPTIAGSFEPDEIVVIRADGSAVQPERDFLSGDAGMLARWWIGSHLEPLTAGTVIAVEGPSDRIIANRVASCLGFDLDAHDVVIIETSGCGDMKVVESIFGGGGFDIPLFALVDEDARANVAKHFDANPDDPADLEAHGVFVSFRDLEDEYVRAIGADKLWDKLRTARTFSKNTLAQCPAGHDGVPSESDLAEFIRSKSSRKIPTALVAASLLDEASAPNVRSVARLLNAASQ